MLLAFHFNGFRHGFLKLKLGIIDPCFQKSPQKPIHISIFFNILPHTMPYGVSFTTLDANANLSSLEEQFLLRTTFGNCSTLIQKIHLLRRTKQLLVSKGISNKIIPVSGIPTCTKH